MDNLRGALNKVYVSEKLLHILTASPNENNLGQPGAGGRILT